MKKFRFLMVAFAVVAGAIVFTACKGNCKKEGACCAKEACCQSDCCDNCDGKACCEGKDCQAKCKEMCGKGKCAADSASCAKHGEGKKACCAKDGEAAAYACPMHPEITSDKAGTCSECGMDLEKK